MENSKDTGTPLAPDTGRRGFLRTAAALGAVMAAGCQAVENRQVRRDFGPGKFETSDGTILNYVMAGSGKPIVMIPGWSQTAAMYKHQVEALSKTHRVIALDMRGHGDSSKPPSGYRIARLANDVHEFLEAMRLDNVVLAGHSMGCSVIWSYWDQYGGERISKLVLIDQAPTVVFWPGWTDEEKKVAGALFDPKGLYDVAAGLAGPDSIKATENLVNNLFFTKSFPEQEKAWVLQENLKFPREAAAKLLVDHCCQDWRDTIPRINVPTLIFGGTASFFTPASQQWIHEQIKGSQIEIFTADQGGSHFMFMENPEKFNSRVAAFLA
jgi:pimeloyl-ACP methyl ester carboxylesterase